MNHMRPRLFWIVLSLIGLSWIVNSMYAYSKKLDNPIFLEHYVETSIQDSTPLTFYYLTNKNDTANIAFINMNGVQGHIQQDGFFFDEQPSNYNTSQTFAHYALRNVHVEFPEQDLETALQNGDFTSKEIDVFFSDGRIITVPIGKVNIRLTEPINDALDIIEGTSGNDFNSFTYEAQKDLTIDNITTNFQEELSERIALKVQFSRNTSQYLNEDWDALPGTGVATVNFPIELKKDEIVTVYSQVASTNSYLEPSTIISGTTKDGIAFENRNKFYQQPYLEQVDVNAIIQKRTEVDADE